VVFESFVKGLEKSKKILVRMKKGCTFALPIEKKATNNWFTS
jgi:hypothetical protein